LPKDIVGLKGMGCVQTLKSITSCRVIHGKSQVTERNRMKLPGFAVCLRNPTHTTKSGCSNLERVRLSTMPHDEANRPCAQRVCVYSTHLWKWTPASVSSRVKFEPDCSSIWSDWAQAQACAWQCVECVCVCHCVVFFKSSNHATPPPPVACVCAAVLRNCLYVANFAAGVRPDDHILRPMRGGNDRSYRSAATYYLLPVGNPNLSVFRFCKFF
jgi:hypothetical protein